MGALVYVKVSILKKFTEKPILQVEIS